MQNIDVIESLTEKITHKNRNQKCCMCFNRRSRVKVRKHKCCNTFTCLNCIKIWYDINTNENKCFVCKSIFTDKNNHISIPFFFWFNSDIRTVLPVYTNLQTIPQNQIAINFNLIRNRIKIFISTRETYIRAMVINIGTSELFYEKFKQECDQNIDYVKNDFIRLLNTNENSYINYNLTYILTEK